MSNTNVEDNTTKKPYIKPKVSILRALEGGRAFYGVLAHSCGCTNQRASEA